MERTTAPPGRSEYRRPGEVDLAVHGVLGLEVNEDDHLDRDAADAIRDDIEHRTGHRYTLVAAGDVWWMKRTGGYPLRDVFEFTADWTGQRGTVEILILGNHDVNETDALREAGFRDQYAGAVLDAEPPLALTHHPLKNPPPGTVNVHGHLHGGEAPTRRHMNVSVEWTDYRPVRLDDLLDRVHRQQSATGWHRRAHASGDGPGWATPTTEPGSGSA